MKAKTVRYSRVAVLMSAMLFPVTMFGGGKNQTADFRWQVIEFEHSLQRADLARCERFLTPGSRISVDGIEVRGCSALIHALGAPQSKGNKLRLVSLSVEHGTGEAVITTGFKQPYHTLAMRSANGEWKTTNASFEGEQR